MGRPRNSVTVATELRKARATAEVASLSEWSRNFWARKVTELEDEYRQVTRPIFTAKDLNGATHVRLKDGWAEVVKINGHTVSVKVGLNPQEAINFKHVLEFRSI